MATSPLGDLIRRQRELHDLTVRQLASVAGISNPYLSQIERGLREPSERVLQGIAASLGVSVDDLHEQADRAEGAETREPDVARAIRADPRLSGRQRQALLEVYEAFTAPRRRR